MLGKVTFLAPPSPVVQEEQGESPLRLFVPQSLVASTEDGASLWVADLTLNLAKRKAVEVGRGATEDGLVEITNGLQPTDKLIVAGRESVAEGVRIHITGEDRTFSGGNWKSQGGQPVAGTAQTNDLKT
jgi:HlyD family secretion protein